MVEDYLTGLRTKDLGRVAFAPDVCFEGPTTPPLYGVEVLVRFLSAQFPAIRDVRVKQHLVDGDYVATVFDFDTVYGVIPVFDLFHVVHGKLQHIQPYFDPSPLRLS